MKLPYLETNKLVWCGKNSIIKLTWVHRAGKHIKPATGRATGFSVENTNHDTYIIAYLVFNVNLKLFFSIFSNANMRCDSHKRHNRKVK